MAEIYAVLYQNFILFLRFFAFEKKGGRKLKKITREKSLHCIAEQTKKNEVRTFKTDRRMSFGRWRLFEEKWIF